VCQEINEDSKLVEGLRKIRIIAKATRTLVNLNSFERSESVASKRIQATSRSPSCGALSHNKLTTPNANLNLSPSRARSAAGGAVSLACSFDDSASVQLRSVYGSAEHQPPPARPVWQSETKLEVTVDQPLYVLPEQKDSNNIPDQQQEPTDASIHEQHHHHHSGGADNIADWSILIPTVLEVVPPIEAAKLAREDTHSVVLSGQEEMPEDPPDCIPQSIHEKCCCCWENAGCSFFADPLCRRWQAGRTALLQVVKHPAFEWSILILIFGSSITLCFEDIYLEENPYLMSILRWTNMAFAILFALEMIIKWFALGLKYYFSSVWTALDFAIVTVSVISVAVEDSANLSALRSLRTLRALRPLRAISRWQGMKVNDLFLYISFCPPATQLLLLFLLLTGSDCRQCAHVRHSGHLQRAAGLSGLLARLLHPGRPALWWQVLQVHRRRNGRALFTTGDRHQGRLLEPQLDVDKFAHSFRPRRPRLFGTFPSGKSLPLKFRFQIASVG
jgi:hypothetical protein